MTQDEFTSFLQNEIVPALVSVRAAGHKEYAHNTEETFANFIRIAERFPNMTKEQVLWVYLTKHMDGILAHLNGHHSQREPVQGRCKDAVMYLCLLWAMFEESAENAP